MIEHADRPAVWLVVDGVKVIDNPLAGKAEAKSTRTTPKPNRTEVREEAKARIRRLLGAKPLHRGFG
jgi:hypothetical protein